MNCVDALQVLNICKILSSFLFQTAAALGNLFFFIILPLTFVSPNTCASNYERAKGSSITSKVLFTLVIISWLELSISAGLCAGEI